MFPEGQQKLWNGPHDGIFILVTQDNEVNASEVDTESKIEG